MVNELHSENICIGGNIEYGSRVRTIGSMGSYYELRYMKLNRTSRSNYLDFTTQLDMYTTRILFNN